MRAQSDELDYVLALAWTEHHAEHKFVTISVRSAMMFERMFHSGFPKKTRSSIEKVLLSKIGAVNHGLKRSTGYWRPLRLWRVVGWQFDDGQLHPNHAIARCMKRIKHKGCKNYDLLCMKFERVCVFDKNDRPSPV